MDNCISRLTERSVLGEHMYVSSHLHLLAPVLMLHKVQKAVTVTASIFYTDTDADTTLLLDWNTGQIIKRLEVTVSAI